MRSKSDVSLHFPRAPGCAGAGRAETVNVRALPPPFFTLSYTMRGLARYATVVRYVGRSTCCRGCNDVKLCNSKRIYDRAHVDT